MKKRVLIIDDDMDMCTLLSKFLLKNEYETETALTGKKGLAKFKESSFDAVLCDFRLGDMNGKDVLQAIREMNPYAIVILITGYSDIKTAVDVIKLGAYDYITKPLIPDEILNILTNAFARISLADQENKKDEVFPKAALKYRPNTTNNIFTGKSNSTKELYQQIELVAPTNYSVILYGESGTGKEVIAKTIHEYSERSAKPFIAMDCGTISKELSGSELFGHVKGSFTGAISEKEGHFELANGGTLFLDEVANLSIDIQAALLRVIQERKFKKVGGTREIEVDVRVIVASNENLQEAYRNGKFREDLFHRFNEFSISIPPLRNRQTDINAFSYYFLEKINGELGKNVESFDEDVMELFHNYRWPGNIRELKNVIRRAVLLSENGKISRITLPNEIQGIYVHPHNKIEDSSNTRSLIPEISELKKASATAEYNTIINVLEKANYNKSKAADILGIDRKTLYNKINNYKNKSEKTDSE
jgi:two-component system, NtrC family, response regulator HydG